MIPINTPSLDKREKNAVLKILNTGVLTSAARTGGPSVRMFEKAVSSFVNSRYVLAVNSGTAALQAVLYGLGVKSGDEVLLPSFTFLATANAVLSVGAKPVFVDISNNNYTMDPIDLQKKITKKSKVVIPVHMFGNVAYLEPLLDIAKSHNLKVLEDAAQSMGSTLNNKHTATFGDAGIFSMYPGKVMTTGEGGIIISRNKKLHDKILMIRNHGMFNGYDSRILGLNFRMQETSAAIGTIQVKKLSSFLKKRRKNAKILSELLSDIINVPVERSGERVNWLLYTVQVKNRNKILKYLLSKGVGAAAYYSTPIHKTPLYRSNVKLPITVRVSNRILSLPVHPKVTENNLHYIAKTLTSALRQ